MTVKSNEGKGMDKAQPKWLPHSPGYSHFRAKKAVCALQFMSNYVIQCTVRAPL